MEAYLKKHWPQKDVARYFRVTTQLVKDLIFEAKNCPEKRRLVKEREQEKQRTRVAVQNTIRSLKADGTTIVSSKKVCEIVKETDNLEVSEKLARRVMRKDFKLSFLKSKKLHPSANSERNLVLR